MRVDKFTQKMQEALQAAQDVAAQHNHQELGNEHFLTALLDQSEGVTRPLLEKLVVAPAELRSRLAAEMQRRPQVHGSSMFGWGTNCGRHSTRPRRRWRS
jgi:ATP-dependent Clp protease ATP-binding subunit ClpB